MRNSKWALLTLAAVVAGPSIVADRLVEIRIAADAAADSSQSADRAATQPELVVTRFFLSDNVDDDGWADTAETVGMTVEVRNVTDIDLTAVTLRLTSGDPSVGCITRSLIHLGDVPAGATVVSPESFEWIVDAAVQRTDAFQELSASFEIHPDAIEFQAPPEPFLLTVDLDLDASGGAMPTTWFESFESGFGSFTTMHLDEDLNPPTTNPIDWPIGLINADGVRCQYSDPDWEGSASYGNGAGDGCFPNRGYPDRFWFAVATDRAFSGVRALRWNFPLGGSLGYTTPVGQLEAVRTIEPVNLGWARACSVSRTTPCTTELDCPVGETCEFVSPELTLKHQVSLMDHRFFTNAQAGRTADRGVVAVQLADGEGNPASHWIKVYPYNNVYDSQANSNYFACTFDPNDDGNDEGDFFDPTDPRRSQGPSSTCAPEFSFGHQGDTDEAFDPAELGDANGSGLEGEFGIGTWVKPAIDLSRFRGRRLRVRLLATGLGRNAVTWEQAFQFNPDPRDDGWFVDDVKITDALVEPATLSVDFGHTEGLPICADYICGQAGGVEANLIVTPDGPTSMPGDVVEIDASGSTVDVCLNGTLEYRFWIDVDEDGTFGSGIDVLLRDWTYNPRLTDAPVGTTRYAVAVRCETTPDCSATEFLPVDVACPGPGDGEVDHTTAFLHDAPEERRIVRLDGRLAPGDKDATLYWTTTAIVDVVRGELSTLRSQGFGLGEVCAADNEATQTRFVDTTPTPGSGDALYWLLRSAAECSDPGAGGSYGGVGESGDRTPLLSTCPD